MNISNIPFGTTDWNQIERSEKAARPSTSRCTPLRRLRQSHHLQMTLTRGRRVGPVDQRQILGA